MEEKIFRKESLENLKTPDQLGDYVRIVGTGNWLALGAVLLLVIGLLVWGLTANLETTMDVAVVVRDGNFTGYVKDANLAKIERGKIIKINTQKSSVDDVSQYPMKIDEKTNEYLRKLGHLMLDEWVYEIHGKVNLPDGIYESSVIIGSVKPLHFLLN